MGDGKNVHGTIVAAETKLKNNVRKGAYLVFMESEKSLKKEIKETQQQKKKDMEGKVWRLKLVAFVVWYYQSVTET